MRIATTLVCAILFQLSLSTEANTYDPDSTFDPKTSFFIPNFMGKVKLLRGSALAGDRDLNKGSKVYRNDLIKTLEKSMMIIELIDLTDITIGPNSEFKVEKWDYHTNNDRDAVINVIKGQMRAHVKCKTKYQEQIQFKTPLVSMGVRGTELLINVMEQLDKEITQVALLEGLIHLYGNKNIVAQDLNPGQQLLFTKTLDGFDSQKKTFPKDEMQVDDYALLDPIPTEKIKIDKKIESAKIDAVNEDVKINNEKIRPWKDKLRELNMNWQR